MCTSFHISRICKRAYALDLPRTAGGPRRAGGRGRPPDSPPSQRARDFGCAKHPGGTYTTLLPLLRVRLINPAKRRPWRRLESARARLTQPRAHPPRTAGGPCRAGDRFRPQNLSKNTFFSKTQKARPSGKGLGTGPEPGRCWAAALSFCFEILFHSLRFITSALAWQYLIFPGFPPMPPPFPSPFPSPPLHGEDAPNASLALWLNPVPSSLGSGLRASSRKIHRAYIPRPVSAQLRSSPQELCSPRPPGTRHSVSPRSALQARLSAAAQVCR